MSGIPVSMKPNLISAAINLRRRAEARLSRQRSKAGAQKAETDILRMVHELEVFKIELEMQSLELQRARDELATALAKHKQLHDFAPIGYIAMNESGDIMGVNLAGASLLGIERSRLINRRLLLLMLPASRSSFTAFLEKTFIGSKDRACEALLLKEGGGTFLADFRTASEISHQGNQKRRLFTFSDITDRKLATQLTSREMEVLRLIVAGKPNKYTAAQLGISPRTVEKHRWHLMEKLKVHDIAGLTRYAISAGIIKVTQG